MLLAGPTKALCDRIAREPDFLPVAAVGRWLERARVEPAGALDSGVLACCAESYGRLAVRWLQRYAEKHLDLTEHQLAVDKAPEPSEQKPHAGP